MYVCMHAYLCVYTCIYAFIHVHTYINIRVDRLCTWSKNTHFFPVFKSLYVRMFWYTYVYIYLSMYVCMYDVYTYMHVFRYMCVCKFSDFLSTFFYLQRTTYPPNFCINVSTSELCLTNEFSHAW
jgi:hypothetical protein